MDIPQVNLVAAVGIGGTIGPAGSMPKFIIPEESKFFQDWFLDLTRGGVIVLGHNTMTMMIQMGFRGLGPDWEIACWTRGPIHDPDKLLDRIQGSGKPIFIAGGHATFQTFMPYVKQFFIRRVELAPPHDHYLPPLFGRTQ